ncbi:glycosyltransferase family 2 protein [Desulfonema ishimotonii]|uniref:Glycosyltransferase family 2 protein n=1 Tax=Desulfonema ishimotonii TaxID=45657 RepID=A0A401FUN4_9BACT|nr:glycosyltransferase family 2 protein [Desulfonema ishimotonii]
MRHTDAVSVCAVIVTYRPVKKKLKSVIDAVLPQVDQLLVIDNGSGSAVDHGLPFDNGRLEFTALPENMGIAAAQNRGIWRAKVRGFSHILFLDQDSVPHRTMVSRLMRALSELEQAGEKPAAVGPVPVDARTGQALPFVTFSLFGVRKRYPRKAGGERRYLKTDFLIASGMLARVAVFEQAGMPDASFFIDNVDMEWCFRVRHKGFSLYGIGDAELSHCLGDQVFRVWLGKFFTLYCHSPLRQYYIMRNRIRLCLRYYSPPGWRIQDIFRLIFKLAFLVMFVTDRAGYIRMIGRGIRDGVRGKSGKYSS